MKYRVFYHDQSTFDGDGRVCPECRRSLLDNPPPIGVQIVKQQDHSVGVEYVDGQDYYIWKTNRWFAVDFAGLMIYLMRSGLVLFGEYVTDDEYNAIAKLAHDDKRGWSYRERRPGD